MFIGSPPTLAGSELQLGLKPDSMIGLALHISQTSAFHIQAKFSPQLKTAAQAIVVAPAPNEKRM